jgi:DNA-binding NarL/FixJ family response regulator
MNKIILADSQAIFRAGTAKVLAMDEDLRIIAQCTDLERLRCNRISRGWACCWKRRIAAGS